MLACEEDNDLSQYRWVGYLAWGIQYTSLPPSLPPPSHYSIPTMKDLGFEAASLYTSVWVGGETEALRRIPQYCQLRCQNTENNVR